MPFSQKGRRAGKRLFIGGMANPNPTTRHQPTWLEKGAASDNESVEARLNERSLARLLRMVAIRNGSTGRPARSVGCIQDSYLDYDVASTLEEIREEIQPLGRFSPLATLRLVGHS